MKIRVCRICLQSKGKLYLFGTSDANNYLQEILERNGLQRLGASNFVCATCTFLLNLSFDFIQKIVGIQKELKKLMKTGVKVTLGSLKNIHNSNLHFHIDLDQIKKEIIAICHPEGFVCEDTIHITSSDDNEGNTITRPKKYKDRNLFIPKKKKSRKLLCKQSGAESQIKTIKEEPCDIITPVNDENIGLISPDIKQENDSIELLEHYQTDTHDSLPNSRFRSKKPRSFVKDSSSDSENECLEGKKNEKKNVKKKKNYDVDEDFCPDGDQSIASDTDDVESDFSWYDDDGKRMKKPEKIVYPMDCAECTYEIQSRAEHRVHYMIYHRDKPYPYASKEKHICHICGHVSTRKHGLAQHIMIHGKRDKQCQECGKKFLNDSALKGHMDYHRMRRYICDYCHKGFTKKSDIRRHMRTHTREKPYSCHICGKRCTILANVWSHIRNNHQHDPIKKKQKHINKTTKGTKRKKTSTKEKQQKI